MNLIKEKWYKKDIYEFQEYLKTYKNENRVEWTKKIINTSLPCLAITSPSIKSIVKEILKGNYLSFLDLMIWEYYDNTAINGLLISKIKDFDVMKKYLDIYSSKADNWATCDTLSFNVKGNEERFLDLAKEYFKSKFPFVRRIGMEAMFKLIDNDKYVNDAFELLDKFYYEDDYYVNMINAWLLCDLFIKRREETLKYLANNKLNDFTLNKMISKCRDSYRVSQDDKDMLLKCKR
ncbi:MAG TPA: DNA alkylation repair protein [Bacilli bacterium]|nr:DNA alkylation repair protein [Bacilli bacterium]